MSAVSRRSQAIIDKARWPDQGDVAPNDPFWQQGLLAQFGIHTDDVILWFRTIERSNMHPADLEALEDEARFVHMHLRASALTYNGYMVFSSPQEFFNDFAITARVTERGSDAVAALTSGMVWDAEQHKPNRPATHNHWTHRARIELNPHSGLFQAIPSPDVDPLFVDVRQRVAACHVKLWQERIASMGANPYGRDWHTILATDADYLAETRTDALARHNQAWIDELQKATTADDKVFKTVAGLSDTLYRDAKNEAMFVKMRVWAPLDHNGRRQQVY